MNTPFLPYGKQTITAEDKQAVLDALENPYLTTGPGVAAFENALAEYVGAGHAVSFANATAALHIACLALGVEPGDTVLTPAMSFAASTNCATYAGARTGFIDCDPSTGLITAELFAEAVEREKAEGRQVKLAVIVHLNGEVADMEGIAAIARENGIALLEDACHAIGSTYTDSQGKVQAVGNCQFSQAASFSFHPVKTITSGEGGMLTCRDPGMAERAGLLRSHGIVRDAERFELPELALDRNGAPNPWYYEMQSLGYNYRLTDIACALGLSQLKRMEEIAASRRMMKEWYDRKFAGSNLPLAPVPTREGVDPVRHLYPVLVDFEAAGMERAEFCNRLREKGIGTQVHYIPTHMQPYYTRLYGEQSMPGAEAYYSRTVSLPFYPGLEETDMMRVVEAVKTVLES